MSGMEPSETDTRAFLKESHDLALWMIQLADTKASILMAASAGLAGLLFLQPIPACNDAARYLLFAAVGLALSSAGACLWTIFPRTASEGHGSLLYYRVVRNFPESDLMIQLADTKASILMAASAGLAGLLFLQPIPACNDAARYLLFAAVGLALSSAGACLWTIFPRTASEGHGSLLYYRVVRNFTE